MRATLRLPDPQWQACHFGGHSSLDVYHPLSHQIPRVPLPEREQAILRAMRNAEIKAAFERWIDFFRCPSVATYRERSASRTQETQAALLRILSRHGEWMSSADLAAAHGTLIGRAGERLHRAGLVERCMSPVLRRFPSGQTKWRKTAHYRITDAGLARLEEA